MAPDEPLPIELEGSPAGDSNQLPREDTLEDRGVDDLLEEGYSPPDRARAGLYDETPLDESLGETIDRETAAEVPEVWEASESRGEPDPRAGRLAEDDDALAGRGNDVFADDEGISGGGASAEEAAVHVVEDRLEEFNELNLDRRADDADATSPEQADLHSREIDLDSHDLG